MIDGVSVPAPDRAPAAPVPHRIPGPAVTRELLVEARDLLRAAGELTQRSFRSPTLGVEWKPDGTPVTEADKQAERFLREELGRRHPGDGILGEEEGEAAGTSGRRWILDPIDGTKAYRQGVPLFSNLLALEDEHGVALGVVNLPALGETVSAARGAGAFQLDAAGERPARVSDVGEARGAVLTTSGYDYWPEPMLVRVRRSGFQMRTWGDGYGYALVATGRADVMVDPEVNRCDVAPMLVLVTEAGGRFTDLTGAARFDGGSGVGSNGRLHAAALAVLAEPPG
jgi:histidinol phosphatase-like enzyme (inositol monophosphatase family)